MLEQASAFITHSGMGGTMEAWYYGTPMVTFPQSVEQAAIAHRVAELGLGVGVPAGGLSAEKLRETLMAVVADQAVGERVASMRAHVRDAGSARRAADVIESRLQHGS
ncbi:nucleotide disphospho-sugar-binding domain-containing protein [Kitasatospora sp. NPDC053057]|uniref:nucleotide disphospho-sugar-binding domain-containing protein n=1 Tax=Kitasatospora sp. NPDC053057 TaxID=3364062 RepID=UPI0037C6428F